MAALAVLLVAACDSARTVEKTSAVNDCARCHGFPPAGQHPQNTDCNVCHSKTVGPDGAIIPGGGHMNGKKDVSAHDLPYPPSLHGPAADQGVLDCRSCHGDDLGGGSVGVSCNECHGSFGYGDWRTNCTFCHGTRTEGWRDANLPLAAPPQSIAGAADPDGQTSTNPKVGAHQAHLGATKYASPLTCGNCHGGIPPRTYPDSLLHVDGQPVSIAFSAPATQGVTASYAGDGGSCAVYCHGTGTAFVDLGATEGSPNVSPPWTGAISAGAACTTCHGAPPSTGRHGIANHQFPCGYCHGQVAGSSATPSITNKALHVNGTKNVDFSVSGSWDGGAHTCSNVACHGGQDTRRWYP